MPLPDRLPKLDEVIATSRSNMRRLSEMLRAGQVDVGTWERGMRYQLRLGAKASAALGAGTADLTPQMYGSIGARLKQQYGFLDNFKSQLIQMQKDDPEGFAGLRGIDARAELYGGSLRQMFDRVKAMELGMPSLPAYPGDGSSICMSNCACFWEIEETEDGDGWDCSWVLTEAEHCETCLQRASEWNPLFIPRKWRAAVEEARLDAARPDEQKWPDGCHATTDEERQAELALAKTKRAAAWARCGVVWHEPRGSGLVEEAE